MQPITYFVFVNRATFSPCGDHTPMMDGVLPSDLRSPRMQLVYSLETASDAIGSFTTLTNKKDLSDYRLKSWG